MFYLPSVQGGQISGNSSNTPPRYSIPNNTQPKQEISLPQILSLDHSKISTAIFFSCSWCGIVIIIDFIAFKMTVYGKASLND